MLEQDKNKKPSKNLRSQNKKEESINSKKKYSNRKTDKIYYKASESKKEEKLNISSTGSNQKKEERVRKKKSRSRSRYKSYDNSNESLKKENSKEFEGINAVSTLKKNSEIRSGEKGYEKPNESKKENFNFLSKESDKNRIIPLKPLLGIFSLEKKEIEETLFNRKELSIKYLAEKENEINLEEYKIDNTLHKYHIILLSKIIKEINNNEKNVSEVKEEIQKAGVVLTQEEFEEINKINDKKSLENIKYKNYKVNLKQCLSFLLNYTKDKEFDKYVEDSKTKLGLDKEFQFNNFVDISEENIYYYNLCLKLNKNMIRILTKYELYSEIIFLLNKFLEENTNLNNLNDTQILYLEILDFYLTDEDALCNISHKKQVIANLSQNILTKDKIIAKINEINEYSKNEKYPISLNIKDNFLEYKYKVSERYFNNKRGRNIIEKEYLSRFSLDSINNSFMEIRPDDLVNNLDDDIYKSISYNKINEYTIFSDLIPSLKKAIYHITNSNAMKTFFKKTYMANYENIQYDFNKKEVIDKFFDRIRIIPITQIIDAFADPVSFKIYLPSNPGKIEKLKYIEEIKVLRFGRYLLLIIHELLGHLLRRYYYYLSNGEIPQNTTEDKKMNFHGEGGHYIEKNLIGGNLHYISIKDIFCLLIAEDNYPLIDDESKEFTLSNVEKVIKEYPDLFDYIKINEEDKSDDKLFLENYFNYLMIPPSSSFKVCQYSYTSFISI